MAFLFSGFIAVTIAVTVTIALTVTVLGTVTVAVTVLTLAHVDVVDNGCQFRELMLVAQHIDIAVAGFRGYVGTAYIYADVCHTADDGGIGHHTDGGGIEYHVIVTFFQLVDGIFQYGACYQLGRVGRYRSARQDVQIRADVRALDHVGQLHMIGVAQVVGDTFGTAAQVEHLVQTGLADIHTYYDDFLAQVGETHGGVSGYKRFSFTRLGRREEDNLVGLAQHEEQVGTQAAEGFFHHVVLVFAYHNGTVLRLFASWQFAQNRYGGEFFYVVAVFYLVLQQVAQVDKAHGDAQPNDKGGKGDDFLLRRNWGRISLCFLDDASVSSGGCQGDGIFLTLLQQHDVELCLDFLLAGDGEELFFLLRGTADAAFELACLTVDVAAGDLESFQYAGYRGLYVVAHGLDAGVHVYYGRIVLARGTEQPLALDEHGVILVDDRTQVLVLQAYIGRNDFLFVGRIVDIVAQEFYQTYLGLVFDAQLFVFGVFLQGQLGVAGQVGQSRLLLEVRQLGFGAAQFLIDNADTVFDEVCRLLCYLVLLVVGILVIEGYQAVYKVDCPLAAAILYGYLGDGGGF